MQLLKPIILDSSICSANEWIMEASKCHCKNSFYLTFSWVIISLLLTDLDSNETSSCLSLLSIPKQIFLENKPRRQQMLFFMDDLLGINLGQKCSAYLHSWDTVKSVTKFGLLFSFLEGEGMWSNRKCPEWILTLPPTSSEWHQGNELTFVQLPPVINWQE